MIPYDSFLIDPFLLFPIGYAVARLLRGRLPAYRRRVLRWVNVVTMFVFWVTSISLYFDLEWTRWLWEMCGAESGRDWMINSGVFNFEFRDPPWTTHVIAVVLFLTYPFWLWLGEQVGAGRQGDTAASLGPARWRGQSGRLEVWYATFTHEATGAGGWLHYETVAPEEGAPYAHGWAAWFPPSGPPVWERFGPTPIGLEASPAAMAERGLPGDAPWFRAGDALVTGSTLRGSAGSMRWDLRFQDPSSPLFTFSPWLWNGEILPGCQLVPAPAARFSGTLIIGGQEMQIDGPGNLARIFGHGNALRWVWLHADLGGGDVLEVVAAVSRRPGLNRLPPLPFVQLRTGGIDWPGSPLLAALIGFKAEISLPRWTLTGTWRGRRLRVEVELPSEDCVAIGYKDPDGAPAVCTNTERANVRVVLERREGDWKLEREWVLEGTAHAEVGLRPPAVSMPSTGSGSATSAEAS